MIEKAEVKRLVEEKLEENMFLVEITVTENNVINVFVDSYDGLTIDQCVNISRHVEHSFDREDEDFALSVSSPGLTESFRVKEQYHKYKGKSIEVVNSEGVKLTGTLIHVDDDGFELETSSKEKLEGHKKKQLVIKNHQFKYDNIKSAKAVISFK